MIKPVPAVGKHATLPLHRILTQGMQIRKRNGFDKQTLTELARSIAQHGLLQPIIVRPVDDENYAVIAGERRLLACEIAGLAEAPVLIRHVADDAERDAMQAVENLQRLDLALLDQAEGVAAMVERYGAKRTAESLGKSHSWVTKRAAIAKMPDDVRALASEGYTADAELLGLMAQLRKLDREVFKRTAQDIAADVVGREHVRGLVESIKATRKAPPPAAPADDADDETGSDGSGEQGDTPPPAPREKFAKLELAEEPARRLLAALKYAQKHKPSSGPGDELLAYVHGFVADNWGGA